MNLFFAQVSKVFEGEFEGGLLQKSPLNILFSSLLYYILTTCSATRASASEASCVTRIMVLPARRART